MQRGCVRVWGWPRVQPAIKLIKKMALLRASKAAGTSLPRLHLCLPPSLPPSPLPKRAAVPLPTAAASSAGLLWARGSQNTSLN